MAMSGLFDVVGHIERIKITGLQPAQPVDDEIDTALRAMAAAGMTVEINTGGWSKSFREAYPSNRILSRCRHFDIPITLRLDAHTIHFSAAPLLRACDLAKAHGYHEVMLFSERHRQPMSISELRQHHLASIACFADTTESTCDA